MYQICNIKTICRNLAIELVETVQTYANYVGTHKGQVYSRFQLNRSLPHNSHNIRGPILSA